MKSSLSSFKVKPYQQKGSRLSFSATGEEGAVVRGEGEEGRRSGREWPSDQSSAKERFLLDERATDGVEPVAQRRAISRVSSARPKASAFTRRPVRPSFARASESGGNRP